MNTIVKHQEQKNDLSIFRDMASIALRSGKYPREYDESTIMNIFLTAKDLGISPMKALNGGFYIVNGKISMSTTLMVDRIRSAGHSIKVIDWSKEKCIIIGIRKDNEDSVKIEFNMEDAQLAGLLNSPTWKKFPKAMLYNRAMSMLARVLFPDVVGNSYSEDEKLDIQGIPPSQRPVQEPLTDIEIDVMTGEILPASVEKSFTEEIFSFCKEDEIGKQKLLERFSINSIEDIPQDEQERSLNWLKQRKEARNGQAAVA